MCILCVIQKWSRRIATMLPWLVIPLIGLWALSQLLPPAFRFEITSPRLACLLVLLVTGFWYEVLMPRLSAWRVRRNVRLRERKRFEAIELQKLRKTATRKCRNCLTAYRDQNPGGGRFMCSYCGHISKRPVLDLSVPPGMDNSGILKDIVGKGKSWSENGWICGQDWPENGNWGGCSFSSKSNWKKDVGGLFGGGDEHCLAENSYSQVLFFACKTLTSFLLRIVWFWRKIFRVGSSRDDSSSDSEQRGMMDNRSENGGNGQESRGEKARRKAEEKRQARLEKEQLEEEERKQREEVAKLVEERRRLRDEKMEAEKERKKGSPRDKQKDSSRKKAERRRQDRKKGKDRGSSKSNSDAEELERRVGKESDQNKRSDSDRKDHHKITPESMKNHGAEHGFKGAAAGNHIRANAGTRYFDRMRGTFLSSRAFTGGGFFGKNTNTSTISREQKPSSLVENAQTLTSTKEIVQPDQVPGRPIVNGDDSSSNSPVLIEPRTSPKKSWQQLFSRSPAVVPTSNSNVISRPSAKSKAEAQCTSFSAYSTSTQSFDNPIDLGLQSPFSLPLIPFEPSTSSTFVPLSTESMSSERGGFPHQFVPEAEIFEDPCYVSDPISLIGSLSETLGLEKSCDARTKAAPSEVTKKSPIESPLLRSRVPEESSDRLNGNGTWQMWNSSPLVQDLIGGSVNWLLHPEMNLSSKEDNMLQVPHKTMASLFKKDEQNSSGPQPQQHALFADSKNGGTMNTSSPAIVDSVWLPRTLFGPTSNLDNQTLLNHKGETVRNGLIYGNTGRPAENHQFEMSAANCWTRKEWMVGGSQETVGSSPMSMRLSYEYA